MLAALGAGEDKREVKCRSLPFGDFKEILSGMMGGKSGVLRCLLCWDKWGQVRGVEMFFVPG